MLVTRLSADLFEGHGFEPSEGTFVLGVEAVYNILLGVMEVERLLLPCNHLVSHA
jgi:hypothetical protein